MRVFQHPIRRLGKRRSGQAVIEFAFVLPLLLLLVFGITEFGRALMTVNVLTAAAREGARAAAVGADSTGVFNRVNAVLNAANITATGITITGPDANRAITVTVVADFVVLSANVLPPTMRGTFSLQGSTVMRFEL